MLERYRNFVAPINIEGDPEQTRIFALLNRTLLALIYVTGGFILISLFIFPGNYYSVILFGILIGVWFLARTLAGRGYLLHFNMGLVTILWILTTGLSHMSGGLEGTPFALTYVAVVVIAGRLLGGRGGIAAMVLSFISLFLVVYLDETGRLPAPVPDGTEIDEVLIIGINLVVVTAFQFLAWRSEQDAFEKEHKLAKVAVAANNYKTELMTRVSHELRTPLGAVLGLADMLRSGEVGTLPEKHKPVLQKIVYNAEYLQRLVDDLLEQSRLITGEFILKQEYFSPAEVARRVALALEQVAKDKGIGLRLEGAENLPETLVGDSQQLVDIFTNLIGNAIKYTDQGEVATRARMLDRDHWQVQVTDTGPGISPEFLDRIFEPFAQVSEPVITRKQSGVGLGLSISKQLVELMGGTISVESELGVGSTFTVTLPAIHYQESIS